MSISTEQIGSIPRGAELLPAMTGHAAGEVSDADAAAGAYWSWAGMVVSGVK